jgi:hypothetical protein
MITGPSKTCTWIGPDQDPLIHHPIHYCGQKSIDGFSYCAEHYHRVYKKGSSNTGKAKLSKMIDKELAELELQKLIAEQEADLEDLNV